MNIENIKLMLSRKILVIIMLIVVVIGGTFAWFSYRSKETALVLSIGDINDSKVIINPYEIRENLMPTFVYTSGVYSQVQAINNTVNRLDIRFYYKINQLDRTLIDNGLKYTVESSIVIDGEYEEIVTGDFTDLIENANEFTVFKTKVNSGENMFYRIYLWLDSSVGNQDEIQNKILDVELNAGINLEPNAPVLDSGMIPVIIDNDGTVTTIDSNDSNWYDYDNKKWANIVLVNENATEGVDGSQSREYYQANIGVEVNQNDILAYYVWIPRYRYKIWTTELSAAGKEQEIEIIFEPHYQSVATGTSVGSYRTHPAFWWDENSNGIVEETEYIAGIWVSKFEATGSESLPTSLPNQASINNTTVSSFFNFFLKYSGGTMNTSTGEVIFEGNTTYGLTDNTDSHLMKNGEWGAVAYLSHSKYGINDNVRGNNYYNNTTLTGCGAATTDVSQSTTCGIVYGQATNYPQSTTGNITGIFDMSGGLSEVLMGNYNNTLASSGFSVFPERKYYDKYTSTTAIDACDGGICYGHATSETKGWYGSDFYFPNTTNSFNRRGSNYSLSTYSLFRSGNTDGDAYDIGGGRSILIPLLNRYSVEFDTNGGEFIEIDYVKPGEYDFEAPISGIYKLEVWGAQGGQGVTNGVLNYRGGYGGYSTGIVSLNTGDKLYVNVGGIGNYANDRETGAYGGYNGGGTGGDDSNYTSDGQNEPGAAGGGATHIAQTSGLLSTFENKLNELIIVAGGGGGGAHNCAGGNGGGYIGNYGCNSSALGGTQNSGNAFGQGGTGVALTAGSGGGGGGYYGGETNKSSGNGGGGGSGYIGNELLTDKYMYCFDCSTSFEQNVTTYSTNNVSNELISNYAKSGNGGARIMQPTSKIVYTSFEYGDLPTPIRDGYTFLGWYTEPTGGDKVTNDTIVSIKTAHTLYARWQKNAYTVNFVPNNGGFETMLYTSVGEHTFTAPYSGDYRLDVWGAQGGSGITNGVSNYRGGYGGYATGIVSLEAGDKLYVSVGGKGGDAADQEVGGTGGYNGGGTGGTDSNYSSSGGNEPGGGGGGATHVATVSGNLSTLSQYASDHSSPILIVAGGGGGGGYYLPGGIGGGERSDYAISSTTSSIYYTKTVVATQTSGYAFGQGENGSSNTCGGAGGGGGYYGGGSNVINCYAGAGGSGYIGSNLLNNKVMYCYDCVKSYNKNSFTYSTTNVSSTPTVNYAKMGNGAVKISQSSTKNVNENGTYENLPIPIKSGYDFLGWYTEQDGGEQVYSSSTIISNNDHSLYAKWNSRFINYNYNLYSQFNTSESMDTERIIDWDKGFKVEVIFNVSDAGNRYLLFGNYNGIDTNAMNIELNIDNKLRLYIGADNNGNSPKINKVIDNVTIGEDITLNFEWFADADMFVLTANGATTNISYSDFVSMSGQSVNSLKVGTVDNRSTTSPFNNIYVKQFIISVPYINNSTLSSLPTPSGTMYAFDKWTDENSEQVTNSTVINSTGDVTINANWAGVNSYTICYDANGGSGAPSCQIKNHGETLVLSNTKPTRIGYTFNGWSTDKNATSATYDSGDSYNTNANSTLNAVWKVNSVIIKYHVNGGTIEKSTTSTSGKTYSWTTSPSSSLIYLDGELLTQKINYGASKNLNNYNNSEYINITKSGYTTDDGKEWICSEGCTTANKTFDHDVNYTSDKFCDASNGDCTVTVKVNWRPSQVIIKYHVNGGTITSSTTTDEGKTYNWSTSSSLIYRDGELLTHKFNYDESINLNNYNNSGYINITKSGYTTDDGKEWICSSGCTTANKTFDHSADYTSDKFCDASNGDCTVTVKVNWRPSQVIIKYHVNGGTITSSTTTDSGTTYKWTTSSSLIYRNGELLTHKVNYGESINLNNYNNSGYIQIKKSGYTAIDGKEWICSSGCTTADKTFDHAADYTSSKFCDASKGDCTVTLKVNWIKSTQYLYKEGSTYSSVTGGWERVCPPSDVDYLCGSSDFNDDNIYLASETTNARWVAVSTKNKISLDGYDKLNINVPTLYRVSGSSQRVRLIITSTKSYSGINDYKKMIEIENGGVVSLDVSGYTGSYYVVVLASVRANDYEDGFVGIKFDKIYLN